MATDPRFGTEFKLDRLSSDLPLDEALVLYPISILFDDIKGQPPRRFMKSVQPVDALGLIPELMVRAETTYDYAKRHVEDEAVTSAKLSLDEYAAILKYVAADTNPSFFSTMNALCYKKQQRAQLKCFVPYMWLLLQALQKLRPYAAPKVHRGVKENLQSQYPKDSEFHWWGFVSTTKTIEALQDEKYCGKSGPRTIFSITLQQQQARDISPFSPLEEGEVLLPPGCRFRVVGVADVGGGLTIIDLEELRSKEYVLNLSPSAVEATSSSRPPAAPLLQGGGKSVLQAGQSPSATSQEQQPFQSQSPQQQAAAQASPASARSAAAAPSQTGGAKSPPAAATWAPPGAGKSAVFWWDLGLDGGGRVEGKEYSEKACYEKALAIDPKLKEAWHNLGAYCGGGRVGEQEYSRKECQETALAIDSKYHQAWYELGGVGGGRVAGQEYNEKECYETALAIDPHDAYAWYGLGKLGGGQVHGKHYSKAECYALYEQYKM